MPPRESTTSARKVLSSERQVKALEMRKAGVQYATIGKQLGISEKQAHRLVKMALERNRELALDLAEDIKQLEIARQEELLRAVWLKAKDGSYQHIDRAQVIIQRITALGGVNIKQEVLVRNEKPLTSEELSRLKAAATPEELHAISAGDDAVIRLVLDRAEIPLH